MLGEDVEDEWQYVQDLGEAWRDRLEAVATGAGDEALDPGTRRSRRPGLSTRLR